MKAKKTKAMPAYAARRLILTGILALGCLLTAHAQIVEVRTGLPNGVVVLYISKQPLPIREMLQENTPAGTSWHRWDEIGGALGDKKHWGAYTPEDLKIAKMNHSPNGDLHEPKFIATETREAGINFLKIEDQEIENQENPEAVDQA
jgi:hypothetical protein